MKKQLLWPRIVYFDGFCVLCNHMVDFLISRDKKGKLKYSPLKKDGPVKIMSEHPSGLAGNESVIFYENGRLYTQSTAVLKILGHLGFPWNLMPVLLVIPRGLRDPLYLFISRNRYRWFGKRSQCRVPDEKTRDRLLV